MPRGSASAVPADRSAAAALPVRPPGHLRSGVEHRLPAAAARSDRFRGGLHGAGRGRAAAGGRRQRRASRHRPKPDASTAGGLKPMNLARRSGSVGGLTLVSRILALVRDIAAGAIRRRELRVRRLLRRLPPAQHVPRLVRRRRLFGGVHPDVQPQAGRRRRRPRSRASILPSSSLSVLFAFLRGHDGRDAGRRLAAHLRSCPAAFTSRPDARAIRLRGAADPDHHPLSDADQPRLAARRHPQFARQILGQRRGADPAQHRDDRRAVRSSTARRQRIGAGAGDFGHRSAACCSSAG